MCLGTWQFGDTTGTFNNAEVRREWRGKRRTKAGQKEKKKEKNKQRKNPRHCSSSPRPRPQEMAEETENAVVAAALDAGINFFDTAEGAPRLFSLVWDTGVTQCAGPSPMAVVHHQNMREARPSHFDRPATAAPFSTGYGSGKSERALGRVRATAARPSPLSIAQRPFHSFSFRPSPASSQRKALRATGRPRNDYVIASKVLPSNLAPADVRAAAERSIEALGTHIDLYQIHWPNWDVPIEATLKVRGAGTRRRGAADGPLVSLGPSQPPPLPPRLRLPPPSYRRWRS